MTQEDVIIEQENESFMDNELNENNLRDEVIEDFLEHSMEHICALNNMKYHEEKLEEIELNEDEERYVDLLLETDDV